jgi:spore coat polysaccharide biosynthesis protein SpsF (cytidylyltransferase family)
MIGIFITARLGSTRLTEKHLIEVKGKPFMIWLIERFATKFHDKIIRNELKIFIATSIKPENKKFESILDKNKVEIFYGSDENIPLRHLECAEANEIDHIISIDGDDILCSTEAANLVIKKLLNGFKMAQTSGLPLGMNVTGYSTEFLKKSIQGKEKNKLENGWGKIFDKDEINLIQINGFKNLEKLRMTLDYEADANFFKKVISFIDIIKISDESLIKKIIVNKWNQINIHLDDIYWVNFNKKKQQENL